MSNLDDVLKGAFIEQEQQETKSKQIEDRIKSYDGASALLPSRQYGNPVDPTKFGLTLKSIIERNHKELAAHLRISTGYWERKAKEQDEYDQMVQSMQEKTEALKQRNLEDRAKRQYWLNRGLDARVASKSMGHSVAFHEKTYLENFAKEDTKDVFKRNL